MTRRFLFVACLLGLFALAGGADAEARMGIGHAVPLTYPHAAAPAVVHTPALEPDLQAAGEYWGTVPTQCSSLSYYYAHLAPVAWGMATQPPPRWVGPCHMEVEAGLSAWYQCVVVVHEYGHLLGMGHTTNPSDVMYVGGPYHAYIPQCEGRSKDPIITYAVG